MEITLNIEGKEKKFIAPPVSARRIKDALRLSQKLEQGEINENTIDDLSEFLVGIYGKQFTLDELLDGYPANDFIGKMLRDVNDVIGDFDEAVKN